MKIKLRLIQTLSIVGTSHIGFWIAYSQNSKIFLGYLPFSTELDN